MNISNFITFTAGGLQIASFVEIREALIKRYKEVYGTDIDLSTGTADGVFVNDLALIINNILLTMETLYSNLDVRTATGTYLDTLCALANVTRKPATYSSTYLKVTNTAQAPTGLLNDLTFVDKSGVEWVAAEPVEIGAGETKSILAVCTEAGSVSAPAGWITKTLELTYLTVVQEKDADIGSPEESDTELRARRNQSGGAAGVTVLESLLGALLNVVGIEDVKIYNNNTNAAITSADETTVDAHSVYVVLRRDPAVIIEDSVIGNIIHGKLTPGIHTCDSAKDTKKSFKYISSVEGIEITESEQNVYWKEAVPIAPKITINIKPYSFYTADENGSIGQTLIDYLNALPLSTVPTTNDLIIQTVYADPRFKGNATYAVNTVTFSQNTNPDTFFKYTKATFTTQTDKSINIELG